MTIAAVSCHVERPLDDRTWAAFSRLQEARPGGFEIAALLRPPDPAAAEDEATWLERAREAAGRGPFGHHTHWGGVDRARPVGGEPAERVRAEAAWFRGHGLEPRLFCGGGWYIDEGVGRVLAEHGYADCTATAFRPGYLAAGAARLSAARPVRLRLDGVALLELPATHSLGMAARAALGSLPPYLHVYFHDTDLRVPARRWALRAALTVLGRRCRPVRLDALTADEELDFAAAATA